MRRIQGLLITAAVMAAPVAAVATPDSTAPKNDDRTETFTWSMSTSRGRLGVTVLGLTPELRKHFGAPEGKGVMVARVEPRSAAAQAGLAVGDILTDVKGVTVDDAGDVLSTLATSRKGEAVSIAVVRDRKPVILSVKMLDDPSPASTLMRDAWPSWFKSWFDELPEDWKLPPPPKRGSTDA
jgi:C-terminal processing protease CtpA/Prc